MLQEICGRKFYQSIPFQSYFVHRQPKTEDQFLCSGYTNAIRKINTTFYSNITVKAYKVLINTMRQIWCKY